ncbi:testicular acid phosphatase [Rhipicephalus sanguineus]|uniref:Uncharacterized protein n=1 Tax=Rhipicephalus sanguineus TaxID=34632 RepID=A0A9D4Q200_RHISA|nr:testicular acid phosphatase [Rhipicephalus sanguineus]KAH7962946.1 hypothetical protein HPB52_018864 [Rhipicephalus sanguineus]
MSATVSTAQNQRQGPPENLLYVFVISRHGQRTPVIPCKKLFKKEPTDYGQLTANGREQTFRLGQFLRDRYKLFLEASGKTGQVLATHVGLDRCRDSVKETLRGLGVPAAATNVDPTVYDVPFLLDSLNANLDKALKEPGRGNFATLGDLIAFVAEKTGAPLQNNTEKFLVMDSLVTYVFNGNPVPEWAKPLWDDLLWADQRVFVRSLVGYEQPFAAYVLGRVLDTLAVKLEEGVERPDKMHLFSMSDTNVFSALKLLNTSPGGRPCFCASILIEVYKDGPKDFVRVLYRTKDEPCVVHMEKVGNPCELIRFLEFLRSVLKTPGHKI